MGQVNLYKIDAAKKTEFIDKLGAKFEFLGKQDYQSIDGKVREKGNKK